MTIKFFLEMTDEQKDSLDTQIYECDMDDEFWWEDQDTTIVTENRFRESFLCKRHGTAVKRAGYSVYN